MANESQTVQSPRDHPFVVVVTVAATRTYWGIELSLLFSAPGLAVGIAGTARYNLAARRFGGIPLDISP